MRMSEAFLLADASLLQLALVCLVAFAAQEWEEKDQTNDEAMTLDRVGPTDMGDQGSAPPRRRGHTPTIGSLGFAFPVA